MSRENTREGVEQPRALALVLARPTSTARLNATPAKVGQRNINQQMRKKAQAMAGDAKRRKRPLAAGG